VSPRLPFFTPPSFTSYFLEKADIGVFRIIYPPLICGVSEVRQDNRGPDGDSRVVHLHTYRSERADGPQSRSGGRSQWRGETARMLKPHSLLQDLMRGVMFRWAWLGILSSTQFAVLDVRFKSARHTLLTAIPACKMYERRVRDVEGSMYQHAKDVGITLITISLRCVFPCKLRPRRLRLTLLSHSFRPSLVKYHTRLSRSLGIRQEAGRSRG